MVVSNRTTWAAVPPAMHKQIATAMANLEVMPLPVEVLPTGGKDVPTFNVVGGYKYVKTLWRICVFLSLRERKLRLAERDAYTRFDEQSSYRDSAGPSTFKNARIQAG
jgi:hypothetical protein